jgi:phosphatidylserine/phosphatidylglycerophosphate/cardiolipin synthase-like enzyme
MTRVQSGEQITMAEQSANHIWTKIRLGSGLEGWALSEDLVTALGLSKATPTSVATAIAVGQGFGVRTDAWQLYFTAPGQTPDPQTQFGIDVRLADAISRAKNTVDLAVFEIDNKQIITAVLDARRLGTQVRMVTDDHMAQNANEEIISRLRAAGVTVVTNAGQSGLMHDKFVILDGKAVWSGSWNPTEGGTYRNNENASSSPILQ